MIDKESFFKKRCVRHEVRAQRTSQFSHTMCIGFQWQIYICKTTMEPFNPYIKKNKGREYEVFYSSASSYDCKLKAWEYISKFN